MDEFNSNISMIRSEDYNKEKTVCYKTKLVHNKDRVFCAVYPEGIFSYNKDGNPRRIIYFFRNERYLKRFLYKGNTSKPCSKNFRTTISYFELQLNSKNKLVEPIKNGYKQLLKERLYV